MSEILRTERQGSVLHVILNRPEKRNALSVELCQAVVMTLDHADADRDIHAVLLSAEGKTFCAGMDLSEVIDAPPEMGETHQQLFTVGPRMGTPIVAAVHGAALGGGLGLVANAHIVIAAEEASFALTEIRLGIWPFLIFRSVTLALGERRAVELSLTGRTFDAREAHTYGLVHEVLPAADVLPRAADVARTIAAYSPSAVRSGLTFVGEVRNRGPQDCADIARRIRAQIFRTPEFRRRVEAFLRKEPE